MSNESNAASRPVVFGEVIVRPGAGGGAVPDGSAFNVARHLRGFGLAPLLISRVTGDAAGAALLAAMRAWEMDTAGIQLAPDVPAASTGTDSARPWPVPSDRLYDRMDASLATAAVGEGRWSMLYHTPSYPGLLNSAAFDALCAASRVPLFLDGLPWDEPARLAPWPAACRWLKLTRAQLHEASGTVMDDLPSLLSAAQELRHRRKLELLLITCGERGTYSFTEHGMGFVPAPLSEPRASAGGAGDAFTAVCILGITRGWPGHTLLTRAAEFSDAARAVAATLHDQEFYARVLGGWTR